MTGSDQAHENHRTIRCEQVQCHVKALSAQGMDQAQLSNQGAHFGAEFDRPEPVYRPGEADHRAGRRRGDQV